MTVSFYRKYRPTRFEEVIGQEHITRTLINAITHDQVSHAYLFAGPRGIGKTSTAKILAMALNCESGGSKPTPTPDGTCPQCQAIRRGTSLDVVEMDAASHRQVDDITESLLDKVHFAPVEARTKVYILDEVHMLSGHAFNALLKTLEEPPAHAVFVLATTEPYKVPQTVLSRCQRFDFRRPSNAEVVRVLAEIAEKEGITVVEPALNVIARAAAGSFRDAVGLLEQLSLYTQGRITLEETLDILGMVRQDLLFEIVELVHNRDIRGALLLVEQLSQLGADYVQFVRELLSHLRDLFVAKFAPDVLSGMPATQEQLDRLRAQAAELEVTEITAFMDLLGEVLRAARQGSDPRLEVEMALIKLTYQPDGKQAISTTAPARSAARVEAGGMAPGSVEAPTPAPAPTAQAEIASPPPPESITILSSQLPGESAAPVEDSAARVEEPSATIPRRVHPDLEHLTRAWPVIIETLRKRHPALAALLAEGKPDALEGDELVIKFPAGFTFQATQVSRDPNAQAVARVLYSLTGKQFRILTRLDSTAPPPMPEEEGARILSRDELLARLKQEFDAEIIDEESSD
ncbi:MAG: DNA polymerase III subunit gamma/tau [Thermoleophilia bacterium]|nr:DNA polymerase III subunit gamma/tau [Thermoleophilia bacterium]